jgi:ABC-2 type transport system permease protein
MFRQVRFENRSFWRNPASAFFTFVFPLMFLVIFNLMFGDNSQFYVPAIAAFSVVTAGFTNIAMTTTFARDEGVLKRKRGTPLPSLAYIGGRVIQATLVALLLVLIVAVFGSLFYNVKLPTDQIPILALTVGLGAVTFSSLGLAMTAAIPNADAAPAVVNAASLPLLFISDIFIPSDNAPPWLERVADIFPVRHYSLAMQSIFTPERMGGTGFRTSDLAVVALWGIIGLVLAARFFSWEPRR